MNKSPFVNKKHHQAVGEWLALHPDVKHSKLNTGHERGYKYSYGHLTVTWTHTGTVTVQGFGVGNVVFKNLNCPSCRGRPRIIQALNYMVKMVEKRIAETRSKPRGTSRIKYHRRFDERIRDRRASGRD